MLVNCNRFILAHARLIRRVFRPGDRFPAAGTMSEGVWSSTCWAAAAGMESLRWENFWMEIRVASSI